MSSAPGPGGYVAAIRASQLGQKVAVVEEKYWGGVCLNVGCIPSKALLKNAELAHTLQHEGEVRHRGRRHDGVQPKTHKRSRDVSAGIVKGVDFLMKKNKINEINSWGTLAADPGIDVKDKDGATTGYTFDNLIIAAGATVRLVPGVELRARTSSPTRSRSSTDQPPESIIIGGSGAIGVEFAYVMANFGVDVTIVEFLDRMVPTEDADISKERPSTTRLGVKVLTSTAVKNVEDTGSGVKVTVAPAAGATSRCSRPASSWPPSASRRG